MEKQPQKSGIQNVRLSRRGFLGGVGAVAAAAALEGLLPDQDDTEFNETDVDSDVGQIVRGVEVVPEEIETSDSGYWNQYVEKFKATLARDSELVLERIETITDIQDHLQLSGIPSDIVRENLERLVPAMSFVESRFNASEVSDKKAFGILQLMPKAWKEHHRAGEQAENVIDQIAVAGRLLEQTYRHITQSAALELANIQMLFFDNDTDDFEDYFMTPLTIDAYHAGMGRLAELLRKFTERYPEELSLRELSPEKKQLTGHDVFYGFILTAQAEGWDEDYSEKSVEYTAKTYAANQVIIDTLTEFRENVQLAQN